MDIKDQNQNAQLLQLQSQIQSLKQQLNNQEKALERNIYLEEQLKKYKNMLKESESL